MFYLLNKLMLEVYILLQMQKNFYQLYQLIENVFIMINY